MGNEGRSGGPQGSKSTRSSEEPEVGLRDSGGLRELASETVRALPHCRANGSGRHGGDADPAGAELVSQPLAQSLALSAALATLYASGGPAGCQAPIEETLTIAPPRWMRVGNAARLTRRAANRLMSKWSRQCCSDRSRKPPRSTSPPPPLFTTRSTPPSSARARAISSVAPTSVLRSTATGTAPDARSSGVMVRAAPTTATPSSRSAWTVARPTPRLAPVTTAVFPFEPEFHVFSF